MFNAHIYICQSVFDFPIKHPDSKKALKKLSTDYSVINNEKALQKNDIIMEIINNKLSLSRYNSTEKPTYIDFTSSKLIHRRQYGGGKNQAIAKAVGLNKIVNPCIFDATGGLGQDAFVLASLGCNVEIAEKSPIIALMLMDGLERSKDCYFTQNITKNMNMTFNNSVHLLNKKILKKYDVIYLDPMFEKKKKTAKANKAMRLFQDILREQDQDDNQLLLISLQKAQHRVVVKKSKNSPFMNQKKPTFQFIGKSCRYDIYAIKSFLNIDA